MHGEWNMSARFETTVGTLQLNQAQGSGGTQRFLIEKDGSTVTHTLRAVKDPVPQGNGKIFHRRFEDDVELLFRIRLWVENEPACDQDLREMMEDLGAHMHAMLNEDGRFFWQPTGYGDERMLDDARWLTPFTETKDGAFTIVQFGIDSPFPYFIDKTQTTPDVAASGSTVINNAGNATFYPVIHVPGPAASFDIENESVQDEFGNNLMITYDSSMPGAQGIGGGDYAEIDCVRNTIFLNGDEDDLSAGIVPGTNDYFGLKPGNNTISAVGASIEVLMNNAWIPN